MAVATLTIDSRKILKHLVKGDFCHQLLVVVVITHQLSPCDFASKEGHVIAICWVRGGEDINALRCFPFYGEKKLAEDNEKTQLYI